MKVKELLEYLKNCRPDADILIYGDNGSATSNIEISEVDNEFGEEVEFDNFADFANSFENSCNYLIEEKI